MDTDFSFSIQVFNTFATIFLERQAFFFLIYIFFFFTILITEGMKLYISENKVILTEGFDGVVPVKYFEKIESWPDRKSIPFEHRSNE